MTNDHTSPIVNQCTDDITSVSYRIIADNVLNTNINREVTVKEEIDDEKHVEINPRNVKNYTVVSYGPINVRVSHRSTPTLKDGRRSKFIQLEGAEAIQRELRREKNRRTARMLKERQINIERRLADELDQLKSNEQTLLDEINNLKSYKEFLEERFQRQMVFAKEILRNNLVKSSHEEYQINCGQKNVLTQLELNSIKTEGCSP